MTENAIDILLVEDNPGDVRLTREAMKECKLLNNLHTVKDGEEAMDFLLQRGDYKDAPRPDLILLDLNLPRRDGREVLGDIKKDDRFKRIPVVVLTSSNEERDVFQSYNLYANCYITKPIDMEKFLQVIQSIEHFWLSVVKLPNGIKYGG
ncbi:MAG: response regulator [Nitrospinae bacterium]|nr:response regulator [Nitrospinota bacterium]